VWIDPGTETVPIDYETYKGDQHVEDNSVVATVGVAAGGQGMLGFE
jgi:hypothetical protein